MKRVHQTIGWIVLLVMILAVATELPAKGPLKGEKRMKSAEEIAKSILSIAEERYFKDTESLFLDMELKLADIDFKGVAINAPQHITIKKHEALPIIMAIQETGLRAWEFPRDYNCIVAATDMTTRSVYFGQAFRDPKAETFAMPPQAQQPPRPSGASAVALSTGLSKLDARMVAGLPWRTDKYRLSVVMFDWVSNTVDVILEGGAPGQASAPGVTPPPAAPGQGLRMPSFLPGEANLSTTGEKPPFAKLTLQPNPEPGIKLGVRGAFTVLAEPFHLPPAPIELQEINGDKKKVGAVVPATLAIVGKNWPTPLRCDWAIPVYADSIKSGDAIQGYLSIDALAGGALTLSPGDYAAYLFMEGHCFGPFQFKIL
ncbi:MAG: hypothetical protein M0036_02555 [Desulfobacteraceae bacterium]|nr:hypothetical protein [Desulfobacteraceae bacterium]